MLMLNCINYFNLIYGGVLTKTPLIFNNLKRGADLDIDGRFHESDFEIRERELITWEYVTE